MATPWSTRRPETVPGWAPDKPPEMIVAQGTSGWTAIETHLQQHDDAMIKDSDEDTNALLVFAGLFSAVLTSFIIESYQWLQEDYNRTSANLLNFMATNQSGIANPTTEFPLPQFHPQTSDVWVNVMWFLSLVFSLSASFLGILVKQWLREYRQWHLALATSRENVRLRQMRYEAWMDWKVPQSIAALPALLEVGLILFLMGMVILLWNLHRVVAAVVSCAVAAFVLVAFAVTVLPAFKRRCPYKSPLGMGLITLWNLHNQWLLSLFRMLGCERKPWWVKWAARLHSTKSWRERELQIIPEKDGALTDDNSSASTDHLNDMEKRQIQTNSIELVTLVGALCWVTRNSQDLPLLRNINQCLGTFHRTSDHQIRLLVGLHAAQTWFLIGESSLATELNNTDITPTELEAIGFGASLLSDGFMINKKAFMDPGAPVTPAVPHQHRAWEMGEFYSWKDIGVFRAVFMPVSLREGAQREAAQLLIDLLLRDVEIFTTYMLENPITPNGYPAKRKEVRTFMSVLCFLLNAFRIVTGEPFRGLDELAGVLVHTYNRLSSSPTYEPLYPGIRAVLLELLLQLGRVEILPSRDVRVHLYQSMSSEDYIRMAIQIYESNTNYQLKDECHTFVVLADYAFHNIGNDPLALNGGAPLFKKLLNMCAEALQTCIRRSWTNCGSYTDLPWISTLAARLRFRRDLADLLPQTFFNKLNNCLSSGLLTGVGVHVDFNELTGVTPHYTFGPGISSAMTAVPAYSSPAGPSGSQSVPPRYQSAGSVPPQYQTVVPVPPYASQSIAPPYNQLYPQASSSRWATSDEEKQDSERTNTYLPFTATQTPVGPSRLSPPPRPPSPVRHGSPPPNAHPYPPDDHISPPDSPTTTTRLLSQPTSLYNPYSVYSMPPTSGQRNQSAASAAGDDKSRSRFDQARVAVSRFLHGDTQILPTPPTPYVSSDSPANLRMASTTSAAPSYHTLTPYESLLPRYSSPGGPTVYVPGSISYPPLPVPLSTPGTRNPSSNNSYPLHLPSSQSSESHVSTYETEKMRLKRMYEARDALQYPVIEEAPRIERIPPPPNSYELTSDAIVVLPPAPSSQPLPPPAATLSRGPSPSESILRAPSHTSEGLYSQPSQSAPSLLPPPPAIVQHPNQPDRPEGRSSPDAKGKQRNSTDDLTLLAPDRDRDRGSDISSVPYADSIISRDYYIPQQQRVRFRRSESSINPSETDTSIPAISPTSLRFSGIFGSFDRPLAGQLSVDTNPRVIDTGDQTGREQGEEREQTSAGIARTPSSVLNPTGIRALPATPVRTSGYRTSSGSSLGGRPLRRLPSLPASAHEHSSGDDLDAPKQPSSS